MIQQHVMASLGMTSRPRRRDRNMTDEDIERLWSRLQQDYSVNDTDSLTTPRLYVVKRVHALSPTCEYK